MNTIPDVTLLRPSDYKKMEWKNGGGQTEEIAIFPLESSLDTSFQWRLSIAQVAKSGPFSQYPGFDRYLTLLEGESLKIFFQRPAQEKLIKKGEVVRFAGESESSCELVEGPIKDLNLIFNRKEIHAKMELVSFAEKPRSFRLEGRVIFLVGLSGSVKVELFPGKTRFKLRNGDTLWMDRKKVKSEEENLILIEPMEDSVIAWIELS